MFKNRHIEIKLAKNDNVPTEEIQNAAVLNEENLRVAKDLMKHAAITGLIVMGASFALATLNQIIVLAVENAFETEDEED